MFGAPPLDGLGTAGGFKIMIEDRGDTGLDDLQTTADQRRGRGGRRAGPARLVLQLPRQHALAVSGHRPHGGARRWACRWPKCSTRCKSILGSLYVNDFNLFGRTWQVNVQAAENFRDQLEDLKQLKIRNDARRHGAARLAGHGARRRAAR